MTAKLYCNDCNVEYPETRYDVGMQSHVERRTCPACGAALVKLNRPEVQESEFIAGVRAAGFDVVSHGEDVAKIPVDAFLPHEPRAFIIETITPGFLAQSPVPIPADAFVPQNIGPLDLDTADIGPIFGDPRCFDDVKGLLTSKPVPAEPAIEGSDSLLRTVARQSAEIDALTKQVRALTEARDRLSAAHAEADAKLQAKTRAGNESLVKELHALMTERDKFATDVRTLAAENVAIRAQRDALAMETKTLRAAAALAAGAECAHKLRFESHSTEPATNSRRVMKRIQRCVKCGDAFDLAGHKIDAPIPDATNTLDAPLAVLEVEAEEKRQKAIDRHKHD